ncbi:hypothetical protein IFR04_009924 [Cadophora malorum]|uniref:CENP-V/GFA domain-containing protein n=1 Tax=Cadophora malorum TaxID=108018 RepID=A0A8H7T8C1_9HELO|nr:hypothetical protein IFR04_009924 [Cadophora malorum]
MSPTTGSCLCRAITYQIKGPPGYTGICHCTNCRKWTGSMFTANSGYMKSQLSLLTGEEDLKTYVDSETTSGLSLMRQFCGKCGSSMFTISEQHESMKSIIVVWFGTQDGTDVRGLGNDKWAPVAEGFCTERAPFLPDFNCELKFEKMITVRTDDKGEFIRA